MNDVIAQTRALIGRHRARFLLTIALLTAIGTTADTVFTTEVSAANLVSSLASFVALAVVNSYVVSADHPNATADLNLASLFGLCLLTNIGIGFGILLLIVPGLYLAARWSITVPLLYAENMSVTEAMHASAARTRACVWPIAGLLLLLYLPMIAVVIAAAAFEGALPALALAVITNLVLYATMVTGWFVALAFYAVLQPSQDSLAEIFA